MKRFKIGVLASGNGTNFQAIIEAVKRRELDIEISLLICDKKEAYCITRAKKENIKSYLVERKKFATKFDFEKEIIKVLKQHKVDLVVLSGFMRIISKYFIKEYPQKIINIHPSLLPAFPGMKSWEQAFNYGVKVTGVTVHFVNEEVDAGPIILQDIVEIHQHDTLQTLEEKIHILEHTLLPEAIYLIANKKVKISGRKVKIKCN